MQTNSPDTSFLLLGAGGHGMVIAEILEACGQTITGFFDDITQRRDLLGYPVYRSLEELNPAPGTRWILCVGKNSARKELAEQHPFPFGTAVHPSSVISPRSSLGEGTVVMAGVCVNSSARIGRHVILNTRCSVDHECVIGDFAHLSPGVSLAGNVQVGEGTHIGTGASVIPGIRIGSWCTIGAGAVVIRDVPDGATVVGVPGKI
ncbi:MAG TPA: acetyltransferase, partial [Lacibacter sp.]|nr:acetyltransferase [Lacibacter sp.]